MRSRGHRPGPYIFSGFPPMLLFLLYAFAFWVCAPALFVRLCFLAWVRCRRTRAMCFEGLLSALSSLFLSTQFLSPLFVLPGSCFRHVCLSATPIVPSSTPRSFRMRPTALLDSQAGAEHHLFYPFVDKCSPQPQYNWYASSKLRNKQAHAYYGNRPWQAHLGSVNLSSLNTQSQCLKSISASVLLLQETRIKETGQKAMRDMLFNERKWEVLWGSGVPSALTAGVAILTKQGVPICPISPATPEGGAAYAAGRLMIAAVALGNGDRVIHVINVYAHAGQQPRQNNMREALIATAFREAAALGNVPVAIGGDWNTPPCNSGSICTALMSGKWHDAGALTGLDQEPTYHGPQGSSRLDYWLVNNGTLPMVQGYKVETNCAIPSHLPVVLTLSTTSLGQKINKLTPARRIRMHGPEPSKDLVERYADGILAQHQVQWRTSVSAHDVDLMWSTWCDTSTRVANYARCIIESGHYTLGSEPLFAMLPLGSRAKAREDPGSFKMRKMGRALRRLEEIQRNGHQPELTDRSVGTWRKIVRAYRTLFADSVPRDLFPERMPDYEGRQNALGAMRDTLAKETTDCKQRRITAWKRQMRQSA